MRYFIQDAAGMRHDIDADLAKMAISTNTVDVLVKSGCHCVIRRKNVKPMFEQRLKYGGGKRMREPFDFIK